MLDFVKGFLGAAKDTAGLLKDLRAEKRKARGVKNAILSEIEFNATLIFEHYARRGVRPSRIVRALRCRHLADAIDSGFDFTKIRKGTIDRGITGSAGFYRNYAGLDCEEFLKNIRQATDDLKALPELYHIDRTKKINIRRRLMNLGGRYGLLLRFLKE